MKTKTILSSTLLLVGGFIGRVHANTNCAAPPSRLIGWWPGAAAIDANASYGTG